MKNKKEVWAVVHSQQGATDSNVFIYDTKEKAVQAFKEYTLPMIIDCYDLTEKDNTKYPVKENTTDEKEVIKAIKHCRWYEMFYNYPTIEERDICLGDGGDWYWAFDFDDYWGNISLRPYTINPETMEDIF